MKTCIQQLESDSFSTQERERRFNRNRNIDRSHSSRSQSDSISISKFFVRNLKTNSKKQKIEDMLSKSVKSGQQWSPPRRQATPSKTRLERKLTYSKEEMEQVQVKEIENMREEIDKYKIYVSKQTDVVKNLRDENKKFQEEISKLKKIVNEETEAKILLTQKMEEMSAVISQKDRMLEVLQKDKSSIMKVKTSIFQTRMLEFEKQKQTLNARIKELEKSAEFSKTNQFSQPFNFNNLPTLTYWPDYTLSQNEHIHKLQTQLYQAKEEIKRLLISQNSIKRKWHKQVEIFKSKKQKDYEELKKKFAEFLSKYKLTMKKLATMEIKTKLADKQKVKEKQKQKQTQAQTQKQTYKQRSRPLQTQFSFTLSDDEHEHDQILQQQA